MRHSSLSSLILLLSLAIQCNAHGYVVWPLSRDWVKYGDPVDPNSANWVAPRGWPVPGGFGAMREDPMTLPPVSASQQSQISPGPLTILQQWNNGANHIGACTAFLCSRSNPSVNISVGFTMDCARSLYSGTIGEGKSLATPSFLQVNIPSGYTSISDPFLWIQVQAQHIGPPFELYQDVVDFTWAPSGSNGIPQKYLDDVLLGWSSSPFKTGLSMNLLPAQVYSSGSSASASVAVLPSQLTTGTCPKPYIVKSGDYCASIAGSAGLTTAQLLSFNSAINPTCTNLQVGQKLCLVSIAAATTPTPTTQTTSLTTSPQFQSATMTTSVRTTLGVNAAGTCSSTYTVVAGDSCWAIAQARGTTTNTILALNPTINSSCSNLSVGQILCLSQAAAAPTSTTTTVSTATPTLTVASATTQSSPIQSSSSQTSSSQCAAGPNHARRVARRIRVRAERVKRAHFDY